MDACTAVALLITRHLVPQPTDPDEDAVVSNISNPTLIAAVCSMGEILEIDGRTVQTANDVQNVLATLPSGWRVKLAYRSKGQTVETLIRLMVFTWKTNC